MRSVVSTQDDFGGGELSPYEYGRASSPRFLSGVAVSENMLSRPEGPSVRRPPMERMVAAATNTGDMYLLAFEPDIDDSALVEFSDGAMRVLDYVSGELVPAPVTLPSGMASTYSSAELRELRFSRSVDVIYLSHPDWAPAILYRLSGSWTLEYLDFASGPYQPSDPDLAKVSLTMEDFDYRVSVKIPGANFSTWIAGDLVSYKYRGEYVLAEFVSLDGSNDRAIVKPVPSLATGIDPSARFEVQTSSPSYLYIGTLAVPTVHSNSSVFSALLEGAWLRFEDIGVNGNGAGVRWVKLSKYLGVDVAQTGFFARLGYVDSDDDPNTPSDDDSSEGGNVPGDGTPDSGEPVPINPAEVDVFSYDTVEGLLVDGTDFDEFDLVDDVRDTNASGVELNSTFVRSTASVFLYPRDTGRKLQLVIDGRVIDCEITGTGGSGSRCAVSVSDSLPYDSRGRVANEGRAEVWRFGAFYSGNYPRAVCFHRQRLVFAGTASHPETVWCSAAGRYLEFSPVSAANETLADSAFSFTLNGGNLSRVRWLSSEGDLMVGTEGGVWLVTSDGPLFGPFTVGFSQQSTLGTTEQPIRVGTKLVTTHRSRRRMHEMEYDDERRSYLTSDGFDVSTHLFQGADARIRFQFFQDSPYPILWLGLDDGTLVSLSLRWTRSGSVYAVARHSTPGSGVSAGAALSDPATGLDHCFFAATRPDGTRWIERAVFGQEAQSTTDLSGMEKHMDSWVEATDATARTAWPEFASYEGETVRLLVGDELLDPAYVVPSGGVTLATAANKVRVGHVYASRLRTLPLSLAKTEGVRGYLALRRITRADLRVHLSGDFKFGTDPAELDEAVLASNADTMTDDPLFTGALEVSAGMGRNRNGQLYLEQDGHLPLNVLALTIHAEIE